MQYVVAIGIDLHNYICLLPVCLYYLNCYIKCLALLCNSQIRDKMMICFGIEEKLN